MLTLDFPWVQERASNNDVEIRQGPANLLKYEDGVSLEVVPVDPSDAASARDLIELTHKKASPGRAVLIIGRIPPSWRAELRQAEVSWFDVTGVIELHWPRINVSAHTFSAVNGRRNRTPLGLSQGRAVVVQVLCACAISPHAPLNISNLARMAGVPLSLASRTIKDLVAYGLATKSGGKAPVIVPDTSALARLLAERSPWKPGNELWGYCWGTSSFDVASRMSATAVRQHVEMAVTGRVGAAFMGVIGTGPASPLRIRVTAREEEQQILFSKLEIEYVPREEANVVVAIDRWGVGTNGSRWRELGSHRALIAAPLRVWCDIRDEPRGLEFAAQLWGMIINGEWR